MNYIITAPLAGVLATSLIETPALSEGVANAAASVAPTQVLSQKCEELISWVRAVHRDGWIFTLKAKSYRAGRDVGEWHVVDGDPTVLDDYAMRRPDRVHADDTHRFIDAIRRTHGFGPLPSDPFLDALRRVEANQAMINANGGLLTDDEASELLVENDALLLASRPQTPEGAAAALEIARLEFTTHFQDGDAMGDRVLLSLMDGARALLNDIPH